MLDVRLRLSSKTSKFALASLCFSFGFTVLYSAQQRLRVDRCIQHKMRKMRTTDSRCHLSDAPSTDMSLCKQERQSYHTSITTLSTIICVACLVACGCCHSTISQHQLCREQHRSFNWFRYCHTSRHDTNTPCHETNSVVRAEKQGWGGSEWLSPDVTKSKEAKQRNPMDAYTTPTMSAYWAKANVFTEQAAFVFAACKYIARTTICASPCFKGTLD